MSKKETGRIVRSLSGFYDVRTPDGTVTCRARGVLRKQGCTPLTGDLVEITVEQGKGMVEKVLPANAASSGRPWPTSMPWWSSPPMSIR